MTCMGTSGGNGSLHHRDLERVLAEAKFSALCQGKFLFYSRLLAGRTLRVYSHH